MRDITRFRRFKDLRPEDAVYLLDDGRAVKVKTVRVQLAPGRYKLVCSPAPCDPLTAKALDHPAGPGGKFVCAHHEAQPTGDGPRRTRQDRLALHAEAVQFAADAHARHAAGEDVAGHLYDPDAPSRAVG